MEKNKALGDKLAGDAIKGTFDPPVKKEPEHATFIYIDPMDSLWGEEDEGIPEGEKRVLDGNR